MNTTPKLNEILRLFLKSIWEEGILNFFLLWQVLLLWTKTRQLENHFFFRVGNKSLIYFPYRFPCVSSFQNGLNNFYTLFLIIIQKLFSRLNILKIFIKLSLLYSSHIPKFHTTLTIPTTTPPPPPNPLHPISQANPNYWTMWEYKFEIKHYSKKIWYTYAYGTEYKSYITYTYGTEYKLTNSMILNSRGARLGIFLAYS